MENGAVTKEIECPAKHGKVPSGTLSEIYICGSGIQHMKYDFVTSLGQGTGTKGSGSHCGLLPYIERHDEAAGLDKLCLHGTTTGTITFPHPIVHAQGELQDSSQSLKGAVASWGNQSPALVVHLQAIAKINMQTLNAGGSHSRCLQGGL